MKGGFFSGVSGSSQTVTFYAGSAASWTIGAAVEELLEGTVPRRRTVDLSRSIEFYLDEAHSTGTNSGTKMTVQASLDGGSTWVYLDTGTASIGSGYVDVTTASAHNKAGWFAIHSSCRASVILRWVGLDGGSTVHNMVHACAGFR